MDNSISFPKMFNTSSTNVTTGFDATKQNMKLVLATERGELFGDPDFGIALKKYIFEPNNNVFKTILIDEIYSQLTVFMPQLKFTRDDITITYEKKGSRGKAFINIKALDRSDFTSNMYNLELFNTKD